MTSTFRTRQNSKYIVGALAGISLVGTLSGCAAAAAPVPSTGGANAPASTTTTFKDGTYSSDGKYTSPGGAEVINVSLTLVSNKVTAVTVKTVTADPTATQYEAQFISGISAVVVGKDLNTLKVDRVAGSSLTSLGFDDALTAIKADASS
ncbi:MAG: hypothetical protein JWR53_133 [Glaciihabitans sp.]|jgi:hypothetical protein|nr:hypothetical protein [Glaciihabitans sp.]